MMEDKFKGWFRPIISRAEANRIEEMGETVPEHWFISDPISVDDVLDEDVELKT